MGMPFGGLLGLVLIIAGLFLAILWILLPFAVFSIKDKLDKIIKLLEENKR